MQKYWPDERNDPSSSDPLDHFDFYAHEWAKHGTCTGMTQEAYFHTALDSYVQPTPTTIIADHYGSAVDAQELIDAFGGTGIAYPQCRGGYLEEVMICLGRQDSGMPAGPMPCPEHVKEKMEEGMCVGMVELGRFEDEPFQYITG